MASLTGSIYYNIVTNQIYDEAFGPIITTDDFVQIDRNEYNTILTEVISSSGDKGITFDAGTSGLTTFEKSYTFETPGQTASIKAFYNIITGDLFRNVAFSYSYPSIENAISYYNSGVTAWRNEAIAFNTWRDNTETLMYDNIFSFTADGITLPDLAGFTGQTGYFDVGITASRPNLFS